ncbi:hypothetical protein [Granulicatella seriolae]|uniref:Lipoprotein n=1 Tax=Granulicatella seriolae TaxID=2967226 RepID=A0ABT1WNK6_9LACT|nr:hypothetical protein [Granulicatella seriolae]
MDWKVIKKGFVMLGLAVGLTACGKALTSVEFQAEITGEMNRLNSYHILVTLADYKTEDTTKSAPAIPESETIANAVFIADNGGNGTRIDKVNGAVKNQMEVIADASKGMIRYHQNPWEETVTPISSLMNIVIYPYRTIAQFTQAISSDVEWKVEQSGYRMRFQGSNEKVRSALENVLAIQLPESTNIELDMLASKETHRIESVHIKTIQALEDKKTSQIKEIVIQYNGFDQQEPLALPKN